MVQWVSSVELLAFSFWFGTSVWFTFISGTVSIRHMERKAFGALQSKLFPFYFLVGIVCAIIMLAIAHQTKNLWPIFLCISGGINLFQAVLLGPYVTSTMERMYKLGEKDALFAKARRTFLMGHGVSSLLNLTMVISLAVHGVLNIAK